MSKTAKCKHQNYQHHCDDCLMEMATGVAEVQRTPNNIAEEKWEKKVQASIDEFGNGIIKEALSFIKKEHGYAKMRANQDDWGEKHLKLISQVVQEAIAGERERLAQEISQEQKNFLDMNTFPSIENLAARKLWNEFFLVLDKLRNSLLTLTPDNSKES